jgi:hypothetical protein
LRAFAQFYPCQFSVVVVERPFFLEAVVAQAYVEFDQP